MRSRDEKGPPDEAREVARARAPRSQRIWRVGEDWQAFLPEISILEPNFCAPLSEPRPLGDIRRSPLLNEEIPYYFTSTEPYCSREMP